ncbi:MAG: carboxypeptidase regulatory-like domain-containing protein [Ignavibacteriales bacterium]|nr:carboxypeptidase regulatory-like domain-containing protein [Ignavibacteriales bacterium]
MKLLIVISFYFGFLFNTASSQLGVETRIPVELRVKAIGSLNIEIIEKDSAIYLPATTVLSFLGIQNVYDAEELIIKGFYKNPDNQYTIDCSALEARLKKNRTVMTANDFLVNNGDLFLRMAFLNKFFGLSFKFNPRQLLIQLPLVEDLPKVKYIQGFKRLERLERTRIILPPPDVEIGHTFSVFDGGRLGWNIFNRFANTVNPYRHYKFTVGGGLLGGDLNMSAFGVQRKYKPYSEFRAQWRYPFLDETAIRQIIIGDVVTSGFSSRLARGIEISNRPLQRRYIYGYEEFQGTFTPDIDVQLRNTQSNLMYTKTDSLGRYNFNVPIYYGQGRIDIQSYDPWGLQEMNRYRMNVPFSLVPPGTAEYSLVFGRMRRAGQRFTSAANVQVGLSTNFTAGISIDYLDLPRINSKFYPTFSSLARINSGLLLNLSSTPNAYSSARIQWLLPSDAEINLGATYYARNNYYNPVGMKTRFDLSSTIPIVGGTGFQLNGSQVNYARHLYQNGEISFYINSKFISPRITSRMYWRVDDGSRTLLNHISLFDLSTTLPLSVFLYGDISYNHIRKGIESIGLTINKMLFNSVRLSFSHYRFPMFGSPISTLRLEYVFPFLRVNSSVSQRTNNFREYTLGGSGVVNITPKPFLVSFENNTTNLGYGGIQVNPFFDGNNNGILDEDEEKSKVGRLFFSDITRSKRVSSIQMNSTRLLKLPAYEEYDVAVDQNTLENPTWVPLNNVFRVYAEPNKVRAIDIPLVIGGTVRGSVKIQNNTIIAEGIRLLLKDMKSDQGKTYSTTSFSTGEFEYASIPPGRYRLTLDETQLNALGLRAQPSYMNIEVNLTTDGDLIDNKNFVLISK